MNLDMTIRFGKYKGRTVKWVMYNDRRYFNWAQENAPDMFKDYKPTGKPSSSDTQVGGNPKKLDTPEEGDERDSWTNPHVFYEIAQQMLRERGEI
jgi:hypothetical protein